MPDGPTEIVRGFDIEVDGRIDRPANGADLLRLPDVGRVASGMRADLVLFDGNPADDIEVLRSPRTVWKSGVVVSGRAPRPA